MARTRISLSGAPGPGRAGALASLGVFLFAAAAVAQTPQQVAANLGDEAEGEEPLPVSLSISLSEYVGAGTFVPGPTWNPYSLADVAISMSVELPWDFSLMFYEEGWLELTLPDSYTSRYQPDMVDPQGRVRYSGLALHDWGLSSTFELIAQAPLSLSSRSLGMLGSFGAAVMGTWSIPVVGVTLWGRAQGLGNVFVPALADAFRNAAPTQPVTLDGGAQVRPTRCLRRSSEVGVFSCGSLPSAGSTSVAAGIGWWFWDDQLGIDGSFGYITTYSGYVGPKDGFTAANARPGLGVWHSTTTSLWVSYAPLAWLSFSAGTWTFQDLFTSDGKWVRFPFWDFISPRTNYSTLFFSTTFTI